MVQSLSEYNQDTKRWRLRAPVDIYQLFLDPYRLGVRIHNNSWGKEWNPDKGQLGYETVATTIDKFVWGHQDFVILVAAGNDGNKFRHGASQIGDNSSAKNCITVGATGTTRQKPDERNPGIDKTAIFSSRVPTKSTIDSQNRQVIGRIKPDVVAPSVSILSAASRLLDRPPKFKVDWRDSGDIDWVYMSGTSMATPLVSGCVALIREALLKRSKMQTPSAALVKTLLINGAVNYSSKNDLGYGYEQGFGRVTVDSSIAMVERCTFVDGVLNSTITTLGAPAHEVRQLRLDMDEAASRWVSPPISIPYGRNKLVATLVYPDEPGALLQADMNLIVRARDVERHGNMGSGTGFDNTNNVEKVIWNDVPGPTATIIVQARGFTKGHTNMTQSFAVAWDIRGLPPRAAL